MGQPRPVTRVLKSRPTIEGAGVRLRRAFGFQEVPDLDPFLLLDDFGSSRPDDYRLGFPWHPHRGIETVTYVLEGEVAHGDSLGNRGVIGPGAVQWMTAGSGIIHEEMPRGGPKGRLWGLQLWANLPAAQKMTDPRYREVRPEEIPEVSLEGGASARVIAGEVKGVRGPVDQIVIDPRYLDLSVPPGARLDLPVPGDHTAFAYVLEGAGRFGPPGPDSAGRLGPAAPDGAWPVERESLVVLGPGDSLLALAGGERLRFILVSGRPLREPVAWHGPIVMNTEEELRLAFDEYALGTFIKHRPA